LDLTFLGHGEEYWQLKARTQIIYHFSIDGGSCVTIIVSLTALVDVGYECELVIQTIFIF